MMLPGHRRLVELTSGNGKDERLSLTKPIYPWLMYPESFLHILPHGGGRVGQEPSPAPHMNAFTPIQVCAINAPETPHWVQRLREELREAICEEQIAKFVHWTLFKYLPPSKVPLIPCEKIPTIPANEMRSFSSEWKGALTQEQIECMDSSQLSSLDFSVSPSSTPASAWSTSPTSKPSKSPSLAPTSTPSMFPSATPTSKPSFSPTVSPSMFPTSTPSSSPTSTPSASPTSSPSMSPTSCEDWNVEPGRDACLEYLNSPCGCADVNNTGQRRKCVDEKQTLACTLSDGTIIGAKETDLFSNLRRRDT
mmetsp:Transcript_10362/g.18940  ORF Transcript_10362/g.18940 Transcript_10362/m.18940 type:complete len:308 (-) Transcript_10362:189-1112(-)